jgi:hypothetical protein
MMHRDALQTRIERQHSAPYRDGRHRADIEVRGARSRNELKTPREARLSEVGGTGFEPVTPSLSSVPKSLLLVAIGRKSSDQGVFERPGLSQALASLAIAAFQTCFSCSSLREVSTGAGGLVTAHRVEDEDVRVGNACRSTDRQFVASPVSRRARAPRASAGRQSPGPHGRARHSQGPRP